MRTYLGTFVLDLQSVDFLAMNCPRKQKPD